MRTGFSLEENDRCWHLHTLTRVKEDLCLAETDMKNWESDSQMQKVWVLQCLVLVFFFKIMQKTPGRSHLFKLPHRFGSFPVQNASELLWYLCNMGFLYSLGRSFFFFFFLVFWMNTSIICHMYSKGLCSSPQEKMLLSQNTEGISRWERFKEWKRKMQ